MGRTIHPLAEAELPPRPPVAGRMMVDLCENLHIHHRDLRIELGIEEFEEFCTVLLRARDSVRQYLEDNPEYVEQAFPTTLLVANGKPTMLRASPTPSESKYFDRRFRVELEHPTPFGEVHIHWRDRRIHCTRKELVEVALAMMDAVNGLREWEDEHDYPHRREISMEKLEELQRRRPIPQPGPGHFMMRLESLEKARKKW